ncbi:phytoene/squalene synthase family protein [Botrimarina sp.]|uniref:phytoene/squalene synthase family protein n=1 Tax=Botrimarina sp. TaxID=2795802 RepID=UPI0032EDA8EC
MSSPSSPPAARDSIRRHSRSFSLASRLLPADKRADVERLYSWCRWCDDGVDNAESAEEAAEFVELATADLRLIVNGEVPHTTESLWFGSVVRRHHLSVAAAEALLIGMKSDLTPAENLSVDDLMRYGFRVAGAVGVLMCPILGLRDRRFLPHATALGIGMQLTNIARDVAEDWGRYRCYLPIEWTGGLRPGPARPDSEPVRRGVQKLLDVADGFYCAGESGVSALDRDSRFAVHAAARIYHAIGAKIRRRRFDVLEGRVRVSLAEKLRLLAGLVVPGVGFRGFFDGDARTEAALAVSQQLLLEHGVEL